MIQKKVLKLPFNSQPIALLDRHTICQDPKRVNRSGDTNFHRPFVDSISDVVEVRRGRRDLISTYHHHHHLVDVIRETKPEKNESPHSSCRQTKKRRGTEATVWRRPLAASARVGNDLASLLLLQEGRSVEQLS